MCRVFCYVSVQRQQNFVLLVSSVSPPDCTADPVSLPLYDTRMYLQETQLSFRKLLSM